mmetsp:Transcript_17957/g.23791  ORF Transcript_17957/g.23791 Transcript_17957/m.23791 type:complete len:866 (+) Transcript_17957:404-3001(+)
MRVILPIRQQQKKQPQQPQQPQPQQQQKQKQHHLKKKSNNTSCKKSSVTVSSKNKNESKYNTSNTVSSSIAVETRNSSSSLSSASKSPIKSNQDEYFLNHEQDKTATSTAATGLKVADSTFFSHPNQKRSISGVVLAATEDKDDTSIVSTVATTSIAAKSNSFTPVDSVVTPGVTAAANEESGECSSSTSTARYHLKRTANSPAEPRKPDPPLSVAAAASSSASTRTKFAASSSSSTVAICSSSSASSLRKRKHLEEPHKLPPPLSSPFSSLNQRCSKAVRFTSSGGSKQDTSATTAFAATSSSSSSSSSSSYSSLYEKNNKKEKQSPTTISGALDQKMGRANPHPPTPSHYWNENSSASAYGNRSNNNEIVNNRPILSITNHNEERENLSTTGSSRDDYSYQNDHQEEVLEEHRSKENEKQEEQEDYNQEANPAVEDYNLASWGHNLQQHHNNNATTDTTSTTKRKKKKKKQNTNKNRPASSSSSPTPVNATPFEDELSKCGLKVVEQDGDGNCLFRAVSLQVYGDSNMHGEIRKRCLDFMAKDEEHFSQFVTDGDQTFQDYILRKRMDGVHGNHTEIQAISELFNRPVEVFVPDNGAKPINIFHAEYKTSDVPIRLSYHDGNHYNAVIDPLCPTAGLGLGLPGLEPGLADRLQMEKARLESDLMQDEIQMKKAKEESHNIAVERAVKESKVDLDKFYKQKALALSDLERTDFELEQAVLASSMESYRSLEHGRKQSYRDRRRQQANMSPSYSNNNHPFRNNQQVIPSPEKSNKPASSLGVAAPAPASVVAAASLDNISSSNGLPRTQRQQSPVRAQQQDDEYPQTVQELVMNGFELSKVLHAYDLLGDNFDDLLTFLMSSATR